MRERLFVKLGTIDMRIISKSFEVSVRKVTQGYPYGRFVKNSVSGLYSEEMRSSRVRALEWRSQSSCEKQGDHDSFL